MSAAVSRWLATPTTRRVFVGGCIDGEQRDCKSDDRIVRGDVYELRGDVMVYQFTRRR